jgi:hypothetical protein
MVEASPVSAPQAATVRVGDPSPASALRLGLLFAAITLGLQTASNLWQAHIGYGYFRDELYYILCGRHLAWGYVDHGPLVAVQARLAIALFGRSLAGMRMLSAAAGAASVFLTGILCWALGGRRPAQALAMLCVLIAPIYLGTGSYLSMNSCEPMFWMGCLLPLILIRRGAPERLRLWFGLSGGLGLLNKPSLAFFLLCLLAALLVTPARRLLASKWAAAGIALLILIALPNLVWQVHNHWPTLEFLRNGQLHNKNIKLPPLPFLGTQLRNLNPLTALVWVPGLVWLLRNPQAKAWRWLGLAYLIFLAMMMGMHAKDYYVSPVYPILFAAGGIAWEHRFARRTAVIRNRAFACPVFQGALIATAILLLPLAIPLLRPPDWIATMKATHLYGQSTNSENESSGPLPQFFADRFSWQEEADDVARVYRSLSPDDQKKVGILCSNYGEASAINFLTTGLPFAISVHNNYFLWGPHGYTGEVMIVINGATPEEMRQYYQSVEVVGLMGTPYSMPFEHRNIYLAHGRKANLLADWPAMKEYI